MAKRNPQKPQATQNPTGKPIILPPDEEIEAMLRTPGYNDELIRVSHLVGRHAPGSWSTWHPSNRLVHARVSRTLNEAGVFRIYYSVQELRRPWHVDREGM